MKMGIHVTRLMNKLQSHPYTLTTDFGDFVIQPGRSMHVVNMMQGIEFSPNSIKTTLKFALDVGASLN